MDDEIVVHFDFGEIVEPNHIRFRRKPLRVICGTWLETELGLVLIVHCKGRVELTGLSGQLSVRNKKNSQPMVARATVERLSRTNNRSEIWFLI